MARRARGRHRKPSTSARKIGLATAPIVAAFPLAAVGASPASAATTSTWDRLAKCESGGRWHINTGNGYYGGLQFSSGTWRAYGGAKFASRADRATKGEQIRIAEKLLADRGWAPWPGCRSKLGLDGSDRRGEPGTAAKSDRRTKAERAKAKRRAEKRADARAERRAKKRAERRAASNRSSSKASRSSRTHRAVYVVRSGDTLSRIAARKGVSGGWRSLYAANRATIGSNPGLIHPGQRLVVRR